MPDLCDRTAAELAGLLRTRELAARELLAACLDRIDQRNPELNAVVTLDAERATDRAAELDGLLARGGPVGPLHGLPAVIKDLHETGGLRTTFGSTLHHEHVPTADTLHVARMRAAGAVLLGKSNTPEFGAGSQTTNRLFGPTRNPWRPALTCGGSSGGGAVALATGMVPIADGSDMGGSLRNPASFCGVVGLRPSPGRVPTVPALNTWADLSTAGPMGRTVADAALLLGALAGPDLRDPTSLPAAAVDGWRRDDLRGLRVAFGRFAGLPFEPEVLELHEAQRAVLQRLGATVVDAEPDWSGADEAFRVLRGWQMARALGAEVDRGGDAVAQVVRDNVAYGRTLTAADVSRAFELRTALVARAGEFWAAHDALVLPVSQVLPFPVEQVWPDVVGGRPQADYLGWMRSAYYVSALRVPAASVPVGRSRAGLPVGLQVVGSPRDDVGVLRVAHAVEQATQA